MLPCPEAARPFSPYIRYNLPWSVPVYHLLRQICNLPQKSSIKKKKVIKKENCGVMPVYEAKNFRCPELLFSFAGKKP